MICRRWVMRVYYHRNVAMRYWEDGEAVGVVVGRRGAGERWSNTRVLERKVPHGPRQDQ